jgi:hypothetical protein
MLSRAFDATRGRDTVAENSLGEVMRLFASIIVCLFVVLFPRSSSAQVFQCPAGSVAISGGGSSIACQCPDGSLASIYGCARQPQRQQQRSQPQVPPGSTKCGSGYCQAGSKCSKNGNCVASDAVDCGGYTCSAGAKCTRNGCLPKGASLCGVGFCDPGSSCVKDKCVAAQSQKSNIFVRLLSKLGERESSQGLALYGNQPLSSTLNQRNIAIAPSAFGQEKLISDPYSTRPVSAAEIACSSRDPFHGCANPSPPPSPAISTNQAPAPVVPSVVQPSTAVSGDCGPGTRKMTRGSFVYCELWSPPPQ